MTLTPILEGADVDARLRSRRFPFPFILEILATLLIVASMLLPPGCVGIAGKPGPPGAGGVSMEVSPSAVKFGSLTVGQSATQTLKITNSGTKSLSVSGISVAGTGFAVKAPALPLALAAGQTASVPATFTANATGSASGKIMISSNAPDSPMIVGLTATAVSQGSGLVVAPSSLSFGEVKVGSASSQTVQLKNSSSSRITVSAISVSGSGISLSVLPLPLALPAGASASLTATFKPASAGNASGALTIKSTVSDSSEAIGWSGIGTATTSADSTLTATPSSVAFGDVKVGAASTQTVQLKNSGSSSITISAMSASGSGISIAGVSLPLKLSAGSSANLAATFKPASAGNASGALTIKSTASNSTEEIAWSGTGTTATSIGSTLTATPPSVVFGNVPTGTATTQTIKIANSGSSSVTVSSVTASGAGLTVSGISAPLTLAAGSSANLTASLKPTGPGSANGTIKVVSNATKDSSLQISWSATAEASSVTLIPNPTQLNFGNVTVGTTDTLQATLHNTGNIDADISSIAVSGKGFTLGGSGSSAKLAPGQTLTLNVSFDPATAGSGSGALTVVSNASSKQIGIPLSGDGVTANQSSKHSVALAWDASSGSIVGYYIYRSSKPSGPYARLNSASTPSTSYSDTTVANGQTYYYVVTAVNSSNIESTDSNTASASIPAD